MRSDNPDLWTRGPTAPPLDVVRAAGSGLAKIVAGAAKATGCDAALIYRQTKSGHVLAAGNGPERLSTPAIQSAFGESEDFVANDFVQFEDGENALLRMGLRDAPAARFAAATQIWHDDKYHGVLIVYNEGPHDPVSPAQSYVLRAYSGQIAALFELDEVREQAVVAGSDNLAKLERLRLFESVAVHARDSIIITEAEPVDLPGPRILYCNKAFTDTTGYSSDEVIGQTPRILQGPGTSPEARAKLRAAFAKWEPIELELMNYRKDGTEFWVELSIVPVANDKGWYTHWVSVQRDITERKRAEELAQRMRLAESHNEVLTGEIIERKRVEAELLYTAFHDNLTRLRNRAFFMDRLKTVLDKGAREPGSVCAVLFLDLDRFKVVNDSLGHQAGDVLLKEVSKRLKSCARPQDTLARFGGDEFALLIDDAGDLGIAVGIAERIIEAMRAPVRIGRQEVFPSCSIGIVQSSARTTHPEAMLRDADVAMYVAKRAGFGDYAVFDASMVAEATAVLSLQADLQLAIERDEFELAYQPIVDPQTGVIKHFEALIRWRHPTRGMVQPVEFVPVAEEMGVIRQIDRWVMRMACAQLSDWRAQFPDADLGMNINTSASEFDDPNFVADLKATLEENGLPPRALELEITESIFLNPDPRINVLIGEIRDHGVRIGLDDFGTGYSSLSYLNRYLTDTIKIDKSFVDSLCTDDRTLAIVLLIIQLAKTLHVDVVAEGVETEEQAELLASMSCSHAQGFYFARPLDAAAATALMETSMCLTGKPSEIAAIAA